MADLLVGIDLGTTGTRSAIYTAAGESLAEATAATPLRWHRPGEVDQDPDDFYRTAVDTISCCLQQAGVKPEQVAAVGIAGQMAGVLGVDDEWRPCMPYDSWLDLRCAPEVDFLERGLGGELVERTGCPAMVNHAPKMRWWRREHPAVFARTAKFLMPSAYVAGKMAGLSAPEAFIDRTYLHFTGLADARSGSWSSVLLQAIGVPAEKLPKIVEPTSVIGMLSRQAAYDCGLQAGIPIAAGLGDTAAGALGAGIVRPNQLLDTAGTAAVFAASTRNFRPDREHRTLIVMHGAIADQWISLAYLSGGSLLGWFQGVVATGNTSTEEPDLDAVTDGLEKIPPGSNGLLFVPHLDGRILPSAPTMRGAWVGLNRRHGRGHLVRAILESVAYEYAGYLRVLLELHPELRPDETRVIGGGARNAIWNKIKASVLGVPYVRLDRSEFACWGAALVAGRAAGLFDDLAHAAADSSHVRESYQCVPEEHALYRRMTDHYQATLDALAGPFEALSSDEAIRQGETA